MSASSKKSMFGIAVLAAGGSSRFGSPKQLALINGVSFVRLAVMKALQAQDALVGVVVGSQADAVTAEVKDQPVTILANKNWEAGMSTSIRVAVRWAIHSGLDGLLLMSCDQLQVSAPDLVALRSAAKENRKSVAAAEYDDTFGIPAYFAVDVLTELLKLEGDLGAKSVIKNAMAKDQALLLPMQSASFDVDTPLDMQHL